MSDQKIAIVICVIPPDSSDYDEIKFNADLDIGIMTQCIKSDTLTKFSEFRQTFLLNINAKLDGINQKLSTAPILKDFDTTPIMFIGAYLTSSTAPGQQNAPRYEQIRKIQLKQNQKFTTMFLSLFFGSLFVALPVWLRRVIVMPSVITSDAQPKLHFDQILRKI